MTKPFLASSLRLLCVSAMSPFVVIKHDRLCFNLLTFIVVISDRYQLGLNACVAQ